MNQNNQNGYFQSIFEIKITILPLFTNNYKHPIMKKLLHLFAFVSISIFTNAQIELPAPSPGATLIQKFGLTEIKVDYSRPSVNGRQIFGKLHLMDSIWRLGANSPTTLAVKDSITVNGKGLAKGTYNVIARPGKNNWEIIFLNDLSISAFTYKPGSEYLKVSVPVMKTPSLVESFTIGTSDIKSNTCKLTFEWENSSVSLQLEQDVHTKVVNQIKQKAAGPSAAEYSTMARYYLENGDSLTDALAFINKSIEKNEGFANLRIKSLIQAKSGDKAGAIESAKKSLAKATVAKNQDYIKMNNDSIAEWEK